MFSRKSHQNDTTWEGVVVRKSRGLTDGSNYYRNLKIQLADGTSKRVRVTRIMWNSVQTGDTVVKTADGDLVKKK
jgi:hypothetical protein